MNKDFNEIFNKSLNRAIGGGISGSSAMVLQIGSLMWLRTTMNYQYRYGDNIFKTVKFLYKDGGIPRFYKGLGPALIQGPLSRFGDTASNAGVITFLDSYEESKNLPTSIKTFCSSCIAGLWRINLMPIDTVKTIMQVEGKDSINILKDKYKQNGIRTFYQGSIASSSATIIGHYPWFYTYNLLSEMIPEKETTIENLKRNALIGFSSSLVSDITSNSLRVIKTTKQSHSNNMNYNDTIKIIINNDGIRGLFLRGLETRIITNGLQSILFTIAFKNFMKKWEEINN